MKTILTRAVAIALAAGVSVSASAEDSSKSEMAGAGGGAVVGGLVGGPPGIVIGAAIGALLGDKYHQKDESIEQLTDTVETRDETVDTLQARLAVSEASGRALRAELDTLDASGVRELHAMLGSGISFTVPFRTDEDQPGAGTSDRVSEMAATLAVMPGIGVQIDGFADSRGSTEYNAALSLRRAESVRELLLSAGMDAGQIQTFGHGELGGVTGEASVNVDELALQRRVVITFYRTDADGDGLTAAATPTQP